MKPKSKSKAKSKAKLQPKELVKLCCLVNPEYICGSCKYSQCNVCNTKRARTTPPICHFRETPQGAFCKVTGRKVKILNEEMDQNIYIWSEIK